MKLKELADKLGARLDPPDADVEVSSVGSIESAVPGQITFAVSSKFLPLAKDSKASALIVDEKFPALEKPTLRTRESAICLRSRGRTSPRPAERKNWHSSGSGHRSISPHRRECIYRRLCCDRCRC